MIFMTGPYRLHNSLMYQLTLTARVQERRLEDGLRGVGLTRITWCILLAVQVEGLTRPSEIAAFIGVDRTATSRALREMEAKGWVARQIGTQDRRTTQVLLTAEGQRLQLRATPIVEENLRHFLAKLPEGGAEQFRALMEALRQDEPRDLGHF